MKSSSYRKTGGLILIILFMLACVSPLSGAPTPTPLPEVKMWQTLDVAIAGTAAAAQTQTVTARPSTLTPTVTLTPSKTPTQSTPTPTFFFSLFTATFDIPVEETNAAIVSTADHLDSIGAIDLGGGDVRIIEQMWACYVRYSPNLKVKPREKFYAAWEVINIGSKSWGGNDVDFVYRGGFLHEGRKRQDIHSTVGSGAMAPLGITYIAPNRRGSFHAFWSLQVGRKQFCPMWMNFEVVK